MDRTLPSKVDKNIFLLQSNIDKEISPIKIVKILFNNLKYLFKRHHIFQLYDKPAQIFCRNGA